MRGLGVVISKRWAQGVVYAALSSCLVVAPAASAQRTTGVFDAGTPISAVAKRLADEFPGLTSAQVQQAVRAANPQAFDAQGRMKVSDALLLPRKDVASQIAGVEPRPRIVDPVTEPPAQAPDVAPPPTPALAAAPASPLTPQEMRDGRRAMSAAQAARQRGDVDTAYQLLAAQMDTLGGDPEFDYQLGLAALDSGYYSEAVFALQRVLFNDPRFAGARLDLARAHTALGDYAAAREELDRVEAAKPPVQVAAAIEALRSRIDNQAVADTGLGLRGRVALVAGYDTNANAATDDAVVLVGGIPFTLNPQSQELDSPVYGADASLRYSRRLMEHITFFSTLGATHRVYPDAEFVDATSVAGRFGESLAWNNWIGTLSVGGTYSVLDDRFNNRSIRTELGVSRLFTRTRLDLTGRFGVLRYADRLAVQNVDQLLGALTLTTAPVQSMTVSFSGLLGDDTAAQAGSPYGRDLIGVRSRLRWLASPRLDATLSLGYVESEYDGPFIGQQRDDDQTTAGINLRWREILPGGMNLGTYLRHTDNASTVTLFTYERTEIGLNVAKEF